MQVHRNEGEHNQGKPSHSKYSLFAAGMVLTECVECSSADYKRRPNYLLQQRATGGADYD